MNASQIEKLVVSALEDIKGKDIETIDTSRLTPLFERIVVATGDSNRQVRALARNVQDKSRGAGVEILSTEGEDAGEWILVDLGDVIVHIMQPAVRNYYKLEELWNSRNRPPLPNLPAGA
ncbi:MAG: ribosome silencing factor [Candidatus Accumulibacter sp.]|nr:ribosome silencing factor [Accumulibacter sp.]